MIRFKRILGNMEKGIRSTGIFILLGLILFVSGCALKGKEEALFTVSPESVVLTQGTTTVQFSVDPAVTPLTWSVNDVEGGNATIGTIDASGLYTAPSDVSAAPGKVVIRATGPEGLPGTAIAFLTTLKANKRLTNYTPGAFRANTYSSGQKSIAVYKDGTGNIHVYTVWADNSLGLSRIWFSKSDDGGDNFDAPIAVDEGIFANQVSPAVAVDGSGNVYVVWEDYSEGDADIIIKKYDGTGFGSRKEVSLDSGGILDYDTSPAIAINTINDIYVVWEHRSDYTDDYPDIYFAISTDQGGTFSNPTSIASNGRRPSIAIDSLGIAYVVWEDLTGFPLSSPTHIKIRKIESGTPGITQQVDSVSSSYHARFPSIAVGPGGDLYVLWQRGLILNPGFDSEIISTYDLDIARIDGSTLSVITRTLSFPDDPNAGFYGGMAYPAITADSTYIYVAWDDFRNGTKDIYYAKSTNGINFSTNRIVNDDPVTWHEKPSIAVDTDGKAYVIWTDYRNSSSVTSVSPNDVFFARE